MNNNIKPCYHNPCHTYSEIIHARTLDWRVKLNHGSIDIQAEPLLNLLCNIIAGDRVRLAGANSEIDRLPVKELSDPSSISARRAGRWQNSVVIEQQISMSIAIGNVFDLTSCAQIRHILPQNNLHIIILAQLFSLL